MVGSGLTGTGGRDDGKGLMTISTFSLGFAKLGSKVGREREREITSKNGLVGLVCYRRCSSKSGK